MAEKDLVPMLSDIDLQFYGDGDDHVKSQSQESSQFKTNRIRSASWSIPFNSIENSSSSYLVGYTGPLRGLKPSVQVPKNVSLKQGNIIFPSHKTVDLPSVEHSVKGLDSTQTQNDDDNYFRGGKNEHLLKSGQLGICDDPYCTTCPTFITSKQAHQNNFKSNGMFDPRFHNVLYGDAKGWARRLFSFLRPYVPGVMNPHAKILQHWNKFFVISCLLAIFVDPLFFFLLSVQKDNNCTVLDLPLTKTMVFFRSLNDFIYLLHMLLQFRLAYVAPESLVVGAGDLVDHPKKIARHYLFEYFFLDLFVVLPLPQVVVLMVVQKNMGSSGANYAKDLLRTVVFVQYGPRLYRFIPFIAGQSPSGFIFESAWANFVINLLTFVLAGHVVGSGWYLGGLQRVNQCLREACRKSGVNSKFIDCGHGDNLENFHQDPNWIPWSKNVRAASCFTQDGFTYGIYKQAVNLTTEQSIATRYIYSLFWGFQQISTLAGNQTPSYFVWEVLFTMAIVGLGLLLFALLIGNMQNFLQSLGRRRLEMSLRGRDVEQWMRHRRLPEELRRQVRESERYNWAATRGVNEEMLLENMPDDLQRKIRRHLFKFVKKVRIFALMDEPILDAICERLRQKTYIKGSKILHRGGLIQKMVFIVRGKMESIGEDGIVMPLSEGDVCGEELLTWCLENSSIHKDVKKVRIAGHPLVCSRTVRCLTNIEVFTLRASDIEGVTNLFARYLRNPRVQGAIRYESPYCRGLAASRIQVAWRYWKKRQKRTHTISA